jgi:hypothetical protein
MGSKFELVRFVMLITANPSFFFPVESRNFNPEDLQFMRRTFRRGCDEYPEETETEEQRNLLARAIFSRYLRGLSERDLLAVAFRTLH